MHRMDNLGSFLAGVLTGGVLIAGFVLVSAIVGLSGCDGTIGWDEGGARAASAEKVAQGQLCNDTTACEKGYVCRQTSALSKQTCEEYVKEGGWCGFPTLRDDWCEKGNCRFIDGSPQCLKSGTPSTGGSGQKGFGVSCTDTPECQPPYVCRRERKDNYERKCLELGVLNDWCGDERMVVHDEWCLSGNCELQLNGVEGIRCRENTGGSPGCENMKEVIVSWNSCIPKYEERCCDSDPCTDAPKPPACSTTVVTKCPDGTPVGQTKPCTYPKCGTKTCQTGGGWSDCVGTGKAHPTCNNLVCNFNGTCATPPTCTKNCDYTIKCGEEGHCGTKCTSSCCACAGGCNSDGSCKTSYDDCSPCTNTNHCEKAMCNDYSVRNWSWWNSTYNGGDSCHRDPSGVPTGSWVKASGKCPSTGKCC